MPRGVRLSQEEKDRRANERAAKGLPPLKPYVRKFGPAKRPLTADEKFERALKKEERKQMRAVKLATLPAEVANRRFRLKSFIGPRLPPKPVVRRPRLTPEEKFERALKKQERLQMKAVRLATLPAELANRRFRAKDFIGPVIPLTPEQIAKRKASSKKAYEKRKILKQQGRALQALADTIPLPPDTQRRVRIIRGGGSAPRMPSIRSQASTQGI